MDLLGCPMCNAPLCRTVRLHECGAYPGSFLALEAGHIVAGKYRLYNDNGQYLLFTAGLQNIRLQEINHVGGVYREDRPARLDGEAPV